MAIPKPDPKDWLRASATELRLGDRETLKLLQESYKAVQKVLKGLPDGEGAAFGKLVQRAQMERVRRELLAEQAKLFDRLGDKVSARRLRSATRAAKLSRVADRALLTLAGAGDEGKRLYDGATVTAQRTIDTMLTRLGISKVPLSERIYNTRVWMDGRLDRLISAELVKGLNAARFAKAARDWFNPSVKGGTRYAAMRLARTEINNAFHATSVTYAQDKPWVSQIDWNLSGSHVTPDKCNEYADLSPWDVYAIPRKPHPQCLCNVTEKQVDEDEWIDRFIAGEFDTYLDAELDKADEQLGIKREPEAAKKLPSSTPKVNPVDAIFTNVKPVNRPVPADVPAPIATPHVLTGDQAHDAVPKGLYKPGTMTAKQRKSLQTYETSWSMVINDFLRKKMWGDPDYAEEEQFIADIDSAMSESILPSDIEAWRGLFNARNVFGDRFDNDLTGFSWQELGYGSITTEEKITKVFFSAETLDDRIRKAYLDIAQPGELASLSRLREKLSDVPREDLDAKIKEMLFTQKIALESDPNRIAITDRSRAASIRLGGEDLHFINIYENKLNFDSENVRLKVLVEAGVQAVQTSTHTQGSKANGPQAEITLQRDAIWKVVKDHGIDSEGVRRLEVAISRAGKPENSKGSGEVSTGGNSIPNSGGTV